MLSVARVLEQQDCVAVPGDPHGPQSIKYLLIGPYRKSLLTPDIEVIYGTCWTQQQRKQTSRQHGVSLHFLVCLEYKYLAEEE